MNFNKILKALFGDKSTRDMKLIQPYVDKVKATYPEIKALSNEIGRASCRERGRASGGGSVLKEKERER